MKTLIEQFLDLKRENLNHSELVLFLEKELGSFEQAVLVAHKMEQCFEVKVKNVELD